MAGRMRARSSMRRLGTGTTPIHMQTKGSPQTTTWTTSRPSWRRIRPPARRQGRRASYHPPRAFKLRQMLGKCGGGAIATTDLWKMSSWSKSGRGRRTRRRSPSLRWTRSSRKTGESFRATTHRSSGCGRRGSSSTHYPKRRVRLATPLSAARRGSSSRIRATRTTPLGPK